MKPAIEAQHFDAVAPAPFGAIAIVLANGQLAHVRLLDAGVRLQAARNAPARRVLDQLSRYFSDPGFRFSLPLGVTGTPFQRRVWAALAAIPAGEVRTYGELARALGSSPRAVGGACRANPVPVVVPCHRVVAAAGPGGFAGRTDGSEMQRKRWLLGHEGVLV